MNFYELRTNNVRRVLCRPGWTVEDIRQAVRDAEMGVAYGGIRAPGRAAYRVRSEGRAFAVERMPDRHVIISAVDLETARAFVREANAAVGGEISNNKEAA